MSLTLVLQFFNLKYMLFWRVRNIGFRRVLPTEQYQLVGLLFWPLNRLPCLLELYYSAGIRFRNCLTEFDWCESPDTVVSMEMRRPTLTRAGSSSAIVGPEPLSSVGTFECQAEGAEVVP
jgi:hypothetical protein